MSENINTNNVSSSLAEIQSSIDNLNYYYALLNSRLTRLHTDVAGPDNNPNSTTISQGPALHNAGVF